MKVRISSNKIANELNFWKVLAYGFAIASVGTIIAIAGFVLTSK
jgi:hypothetical protein